MSVEQTMKAKAPKASEGQELTAKGDPRDCKRILAKMAADPITRNALAADLFTKHFGELDINAAIEELDRQAQAVQSGDMKLVEARLVAQADTLDAIFTGLLRRATANMGEHLGAADTYMRLALRAQSQCRATLETLATIKNPPVVFTKQANIAHGIQQVNNSVETSAACEKTENAQTKLLEHSNGEQWLDTRTAVKTVHGDQEMATVEALHRAADRAREK